MQKVLNVFDEFIEQGSFGRHETFTPRYGWIKKGFDALKNDGYCFKVNDAIERLGVGKNMVISIKYWCMTFKIAKQGNNDKSFISPTKFGELLLGKDGWDPYLEDPASLWLLHWQLFIPTLSALNWIFAFNKASIGHFNNKQLVKLMIASAQKYSKFSTISETTFEKDASCLIRMYSDTYSDRNSEIDCPFSQLDLMFRTEGNSEYTFNNGFKQTLPSLIFAAACFSYLHNYSSRRQQSISLQRLTYDFNSPGIAFKISESVAGTYLDDVSNKLSGMTFRDDLNGPRLYLEKSPEVLYWETLNLYYKEQNA
ncbi:MAG: hypothetical protein AVO34_07600 [Firmicutes bacterium ML8_F2]|jgi:hypothetical protein|nr:MAG: hypothetical protein AVO34_07600 [Firmicutes bacterium ML8_F2]